MAVIERKKNAISGTITGIILQLFNLIIPFVIRTIFINQIGIEYAGLDSLFKSILQVLNLAELGVGSALVFSMYKPVVEDDYEKLCALMCLYKKYYRIIGIVVLIVGLSIMPFLPHFISGTVPEDLNLYVLYILNLSATVLSYWLFAYRSSIIQAYQRLDIINICTFVVNLIKYTLQIISIFLWKNYYIYLVISLFFQLVLNCAIAVISKIRYPNFKAIGTISDEEKRSINSKVRYVFTARLGSVIVNSGDTIVISSFLGLSVLAIYANYYYIISAIFAIFMVMFNAVKAGIGNSLIVETKEKNLRDFYRFTFIVMFFIAVCSPCFLTLYQPFITLWVGKECLLDFDSVILFVIYFVVYLVPIIWTTYKDAAGIWKEDRFRPLIGATINLVLNIILVNFIGLNGVLLSTIISYLLISIPWLLYNMKKKVVDYDVKKYLMMMFLYILTIVAVCTISYYICTFVQVNGFLEIVVKFFISIGISTFVFCVAFCWTSEFKYSINLFKNILWRKK